MPKETQMNHHQRACQVWAVLVYAAEKSESITYKKLSRLTGLKGPMDTPLAYIQEYCLIEGLPPLTALVVYDNGFPGDGFFAVSPNDIGRAQQLVFSHNWEKLPKKTPATYTYREWHEKWEGLSAKERGEYVKACCDSVQIMDVADSTHAGYCPKCKKAGGKKR